MCRLAQQGPGFRPPSIAASMAALEPRPREKGGASREELHWGRTSVVERRGQGHVGRARGRGTRKRPRDHPITAAAGRPTPVPPLAATPAPPGPPAPPAMGEEDYYLELCERPVHFEKANPVNCVFFDEANKQVGAARTLLPARPPPGAKAARAPGGVPGPAGPPPAPSCPRPGTSLLRPGSLPRGAAGVSCQQAPVRA